MVALYAVPCPVVVTNGTGRVLQFNDELVRVAGRSRDSLCDAQIDSLLPPSGRIFMQTHVWPMLLRDGLIREIYLQLLDGHGELLPVIVNGDQVRADDGTTTYVWVLFVAQQRSRFEGELLKARKRADDASAALVERERFLRTVTEAVPGLVAYWDKNLICLFANSSHSVVPGLEDQPLIGQHLRDIKGSPLFDKWLAHADTALRGQALSFETRISRPDNTPQYHLNHFIPDRTLSGDLLGFFVLSVDVSSLKAAEVELRLAERVVQSTSEGIVVTDAGGFVLTVNPAFAHITGYTEPAMLGSDARSLIASHTRRFFSTLQRGLKREATWQGEIWARRKSGDLFLAWLTITLIAPDADTPARYVIIFRDVTERWQDDERIRHLALHDALTDLPNRTLLYERLQQIINQSAREPRTAALLFLDLDGFKSVNDSMGHATGDALLKEIAQRLTGLVRHSDTVARLGGDEFIILIDNPRDIKEVAQVAQRAVDAIARPMQLGSINLQVGASVGVAIYPQDATGCDQLLACADAALYKAKNSGKGVYNFFRSTAD